MNRDDRHRPALLLELVRDLERHLHDRAVGEDADVLARLEEADLAEHKRLGGVGGKVRLAGLAEPQIGRAVALGAGPGGRLRFHRVAGRDDRHVGQARP